MFMRMDGGASIIVHIPVSPVIVEGKLPFYELHLFPVAERYWNLLPYFPTYRVVITFYYLANKCMIYDAFFVGRQN